MKLAHVVLVVAACHGNEARRGSRDDAARVASTPIDAPAADAAIDAVPLPSYSIEFPGPARTRETSVQTVSGPMQQKVETAELAGITYMIVSGALPEGLAQGNGPGGQDRILATFGAKATRDVAIKLGDIDGREVRFAGPANGILHTYVVGSWMVQAGVVARTGAIDEPRAKRFFDSLKIAR